MERNQLGPYRLQRLIGRGGMGAVYEAVHETTGDRVAVKVLTSARSQDESFRRRFEAEIKTLILLHHPHIVSIKSHGQDQGHLFFAMHLVDGPSLYQKQKAVGTLPWAEVVAYTLDICEGLRHAHDRGFIHRDLKPGNLLIDPQNRVLITDFGIARDTAVTREQINEQMTSPGGVLGTLDFMSPEQISGKAATIRSDLYSLGCVMYCLLSGRTPFSFKSVSEAQATLQSAKPTRLGVLVPNLPRNLERIVMRLLEVDPSKRFGSARAVSKRLHEFLEERGLHDESETDTSVGRVSDDFKLNEDGAIHVQRTEVEPADPRQAEAAPSSASPGKPRAERPAPKPLDQETPTVVGGEPTWQGTGQADYFAPVTDADRRDSSDWLSPKANRDEGPIWPYVTGLLVVLGLLLFGLYLTVFQKPTADRLWSNIQSQLDEGVSVYQLDTDLERFLKLYPEDPRREKIIRLKQQLAAQGLPQRLERIVRLRGPDALTDLERETLAALRLSETAPEEALPRMEALLKVYSMPQEQRDISCRFALQQQVNRLQDIVAAQRARRAVRIEESLAQLDTDSERAVADRIDALQALLVLYGHDPELAQPLQEVRRRLDELVETSASPSNPEASENSNTSAESSASESQRPENATDSTLN